MKGVITELGYETNFGEVFDREAALHHLNGNEVFLRDLSAEFFGNSQTLVDRVRRAVQSRSDEELVRATQTLRTVANYFCAHRLIHAAETMEQMARTGKLYGIQKACLNLELEVQHLREVLRSYLRWSTARADSMAVA